MFVERILINRSSRSVWYKPEGSETPVELPPGKTFWGYQDGVTRSGCDGRVFKTTDFVDVLVTDDDIYALPGPYYPGQVAGGGWKSRDWASERSNWKPLSDKGL